MAAAPQSGQSDNSMAILWIGAAIVVAAFIIWYYFKVQIVEVYFQLKLFEINLLSPFTKKLDDVRTIIQSTSIQTVSVTEVLQIGKAVGHFLRIPCVLLILILAFIVYYANVNRLYKNIYSMKSLAEFEKTNWPQITPVTQLDLVKTDINKGRWAMALTPIQFCKKYQLVQEFKRSGNETSYKNRGKVEVALLRGKANQVFALQLGPLWEKITKCPPHVRALFAIFAARINGDTQGALALIAQIARSSAGTLNFSGMDVLIKKHANSPLVLEIVNAHAYVLTVIASMLAGARMDGVQGTADFLWVKPIDRRLWYMINTVGRQTPFVEVAGPFAHWVAEKEIGRKLVMPMVEEATNALELALKETIYRTDET